MKKKTLLVLLQDIGFGHLGNGYTVWDRTKNENGDFMRIAHINRDRTVTYYKELEPHVMEFIQTFADTDTGSVSTCQPEQKVLNPIIDSEVGSPETPSLTFAQFQATKKRVSTESITSYTEDKDSISLLYLDALHIEIDENNGGYSLVIGNQSWGCSDDLGLFGLETILWEYGISEEYFKPVFDPESENVPIQDRRYFADYDTLEVTIQDLIGFQDKLKLNYTEEEFAKIVSLKTMERIYTLNETLAIIRVK